MKTYYWVAINGASCSMSSFPLPTTVRVKPVPQLLLGFDTAKEARETQHFLLTADSSACQKRLRELAQRSQRGEIVSIAPLNPEPPTAGGTMWSVEPAH